MRTIEIKGKAYPLRFGQNAMYRLERLLFEMEEERISKGGRPYGEMLTDPITGKIVFVARQGLGLLKHYPDNVATHLVFWAGLEYGRIKHGTRLQPYTVDDAGDLIDQAGGIDEISGQTWLAYMEANQSKFTEEQREKLVKLEEARLKLEASRKNDQPAPEPAPVPGKEAGKHGKSVSSKGSKRDSPSKPSGI